MVANPRSAPDWLDDLPANSPPPAPPMDEESAHKLIAKLWPDAKITSGYRTPEHNAEVHGVEGSMHTRGGGEAVDFVKGGLTKAEVEEALKKQGVPVSELLDEGSHIHWAWGPKGKKMAEAKTAAPKGQGDPYAQERADAMKSVEAAEKTVQKSDEELKADTEQYNRELTEARGDMRKMVADLPKPPTLDKLPPPPEAIKSQPTQVLGQFLPMLAVLAGSRARGGAIGAMNAAAAAMNARRKNDADALKDANTQWREQMDVAHEKWTEERDSYLDVINNTKMTMDERVAELHTLALAHGNKQFLNSVDHGNLKEAYHQLQILDTADIQAHRVALEADRNKIAQEDAETKRLAEADRKAHYERMDPAVRAKAIRQVRQDIATSPLGKSYANVQQYLPLMENAEQKIKNKPWNKDNALGSQEQAAFLDAYTKIITGGQAIRGFTLKLNQDHAGLGSRANILLQQLGKGGPIDSRMEKEMVDVAKEYAAALDKEYKAADARALQDFRDVWGEPPNARDLEPYTYDPGSSLPMVGDGGIQVTPEDLATLKREHSPADIAEFNSHYGQGAAEAILGGR